MTAAGPVPQPEATLDKILPTAYIKWVKFHWGIV